jgi:hypothetical protein
MITAEILEIRPATAPDIVRPRPASATPAGAELVRLFGLDRLPARRPLGCHWQRDPEGRLASFWVAPVSQP